MYDLIDNRILSQLIEAVNGLIATFQMWYVLIALWHIFTL